ncbi:MAG: hypothetical protein JW871_06070 [Endomicrobiales bacterium]|nr:hypothetical protein [Endomicrobiales bacterium]
MNPVNTLFQDPIIIAASLVLVATVVILIWALKNYQLLNEESDEMVYDEPSESQQKSETPGLLEARMHEISTQLSMIEQRLREMDRVLREKKPADATMPNLVTTQALETFMKSLESKLESIAAEKSKAPQKTDDFERIETKLDSIRKLLVLLSDSNNPSEQP